jgi:ketosteroid isomerase-like protein
MRSRWIVVVLGMWLTGSAAAAAQQRSPSATSADEAAIRAVIATYAKAVDAADPNIASTIWAHTPGVSFIYPLGHEHGLEAIKTAIYERAMGQRFVERRLTVKDIAIHCYGDSGWAEFYWDFAAKLRKDGSAVATHGRETQIYRKIKGEWRLVHVHYSGMPPAPERPGS